MSDEVKCRHCSRDSHPFWMNKYNGLCIECSRAGIGELLDRISELESQLGARPATRYVHPCGYISDGPICTKHGGKCLPDSPPPPKIDADDAARVRAKGRRLGEHYPVEPQPEAPPADR